jgi:hypothetical protein
MARSIRLEGLPATEEIRPGGTCRIALTVTNAGEIVDQYSVALSGLQEDWYTLVPAAVSLFPGASARVELTLNPPIGKAGQAGNYPFSVTATSSSDPATGTSADAELRITAEGKPGMDVRPLRAEGRTSSFRVTWKNPSNSPVNIELAVRDAEHGIRAFINPVGSVPVPAGEERTVQVTVQPRRRETVGQPHAYELEFLGLKPSTEDLLEPGLKRFGHYTYVPPIRTLALPLWLRRLPIWALLALLLLLVAVLFLGGRKVGNVVADSAKPTATLTAIPTATMPKPTSTTSPTAVPTLVPPPSVGSFGVQVSPDGSTSIAWAVKGAKQVTLDGKKVGATGKIPVKVTKAQTFVLSASDAGGTMSRLLQVVPPPIKKLSVALPPRHLNLPTIQQFSVSTDKRTGALALAWTINGADRCLLNNQPVAAIGSKKVTANDPRSLVLQALNGAGVTTSTLKLPSSPAPRSQTLVLKLPSIPVFTLNHPKAGHPYSLVWQTINATSATINGVPVLVTGSQILHPPLKTMTYVLVARNRHAQVTGRVEVNVS